MSTDPRSSASAAGHASTIRLSGLSVRYGRGRGARRALDSVDLDLTTGVHGLLGPNGAGKTTLMRVLATILTATSGEVRLLGRDVRHERDRRQIRRQLGYLPQAFGSYPRFTVREFVAYFAWLKEVPSRRAAAAVDRAIERVGLADRADTRMKSLSGGMLRRAGLAQALVNDPDVLLLDEPTVGLDPEQRITFRRLLREVGADTTVLISTHIVDDVAAICDQAILVREGRVVLRTHPAQLERLGAAFGSTEDGTSALERGYTAALHGRAVPSGVAQ
ncbi:ATP-binding cassette domain-containing protein [Micromonospora thermarum]|uniref:ATP-binding cassette domain-containing protein n=1 Tax=Micromonospora thermarum TaxID=2720024 RepID=A0ABX0Z7A4_9ACTN|nr:ATP-binding cassette domain-containing protein [Micromonospora thermarum]NJP31943.1 ATP-binding cassette domain-containing protein [Micromonospora thermarum]